LIFKGVHCIGDKANNVMLDIYENLIKEGATVSEWRPRIEHAQIFAPADLERIGKLGGQLTDSSLELKAEVLCQ